MGRGNTASFPRIPASPGRRATRTLSRVEMRQRAEQHAAFLKTVEADIEAKDLVLGNLLLGLISTFLCGHGIIYVLVLLPLTIYAGLSIIDAMGKNLGWSIGTACLVSGLIVLAIGLLIYGKLTRKPTEDAGHALLKLCRSRMPVAMDEVQKLIASGININKQDPFPRLEKQDTLGATALSYAVDRGHREVVSELIRVGADLEVKDKDGRTAIFYCDEGWEAMEELIRAGAALDIQENKGGGMTILMFAAKEGSTKIVRELVRAGVATELLDNEGKTALDHASKTEIKKILRGAMNKKKREENRDGGNTRTTSLNEGKAEMVAAVTGESKAGEDQHGGGEEQKLTHASATLNVQNTKATAIPGEEANMGDAAREGKEGKEQPLTLNTPSVAAAVPVETSPRSRVFSEEKCQKRTLMVAAARGNTPMVRELIRAGANLDAQISASCNASFADWQMQVEQLRKDAMQAKENAAARLEAEAAKKERLRQRRIEKAEREEKEAEATEMTRLAAEAAKKERLRQKREEKSAQKAAEKAERLRQKQVQARAVQEKEAQAAARVAAAIEAEATRLKEEKAEATRREVAKAAKLEKMRVQNERRKAEREQREQAEREAEAAEREAQQEEEKEEERRQIAAVERQQERVMAAAEAAAVEAAAAEAVVVAAEEEEQRVRTEIERAREQEAQEQEHRRRDLESQEQHEEEKQQQLKQLEELKAFDVVEDELGALVADMEAGGGEGEEGKDGGEETADNMCDVCFDAEKTHVFVPCGHQCTCEACATHIMADTALCPVCREKAVHVMRVFKT